MLFGLVLCGGKSTRMGTDKSMLRYHKQPQRYHLYSLLQQLCDRTFISCNEAQAETIPPGYEFIKDEVRYQEIGPMGGLLSAQAAYPNASFLVIGCDYPFAGIDDFKPLISHWRQSNRSVTYINREGVEEPLMALYDSGISQYMQECFAGKKYSLRSLLKEVNAIKLHALNERSLQSIDTLEGYTQATLPKQDTNSINE